MKKFVFSLARILDYRQSMLDKEKNALMQLVAQRNAVEVEIDKAEAGYVLLAQERTQTAAAGTTVLELQQLEMKLQGQKRRLEELQTQLTQLEEEIDRQREVVQQASQEVKGLELLRDHQREGYETALRKEEEDRIGELMSAGLFNIGDRSDQQSG